ncbi:hypothetical protein GCM10022204_13450 [Microlunatus aurantiacus]|uniref:Uncharacterized protein n=1 Tax=Microlunatus aurantiacus TaxID=446786 RepID=A0ABP7CZ62_9ACTN
MSVMSIGAVCFGIAIGFIAYRTLVRKDSAAITDISAVVGAVGGGAVTVWFDPSTGDTFGWYSIGLLIGMAIYYVQFLVLNGKREAATRLGGAGDVDAGI